MCFLAMGPGFNLYSPASVALLGRLREVEQPADLRDGLAVRRVAHLAARPQSRGRKRRPDGANKINKVWKTTKFLFC
jgi:hypothetical protein